MSKNYVLIQGLGLNQGGVGAAKYFAEKGRQVLVTDLKTEEELQPSVKALSEFDNIRFVLGGHREEDFAKADLLISTPVVPPASKFVQIAKENGVPSFCPMTYFFEHKKGTVIGITGTRGKSTTSNLIFQILKKAGKDVYLGGNIGRSVLDFLDKLSDESISVVELSSFMLDWLGEIKKSPEIAVLTNIYPDHIKHHGSMEDYIQAKKQVFKYQNSQDTAFFNFGNNICAAMAGEVPGQVVDFNSVEIDFDKLNLSQFHPLSGGHNRKNIQAASAVCRHLGVDEETIFQAVKDYEGLYGRQMNLGEFNGVKVVNDTCATIPEAAVAALERFSGFPIILITGGKDKGVDYSGLVKKIDEVRPKAVIMLKGTVADKLSVELDKLGINYKQTDSLENSVKSAFEIADKRDLILLSPGGSSFERFANEFDRGRQFDELVRKPGHDKILCKG
jgi:UDP-N-acetylmuramoylalanine--D-glutamate ligase